jgi:2-(1,2-epoxy-1,2-dihydrophenyl)acetyl-CoA isomerase
MTHVRQQRHADGLLEVIIDRPARLNALTCDMLGALRQIVAEASDDVSVTAVLLRGEGRSFCTGRDLGDAAPGEDAHAIVAEQINPLIHALYMLEIPTLAAVRGPVMGIGLGLALACDVVIAGHSAALSSPFIRLGASLDSGGHFFLARALGVRRALALVYSAQPITGEALVTAGLAAACVADEAVDAVALERAHSLARGPATALRLHKRLMRSASELGLAEVLAQEAANQGHLAGTPEYAEGLAAFAARREPDFLAARRKLQEFK